MTFTPVDEVVVVQMQTHLPALRSAVTSRNPEAVKAVYRTLETQFWVDGPHAAAMLLADALNQRDSMFRRANTEATKFAEAYMEEKRRGEEWREVNKSQAAMIAHLKSRVRDMGGEVA